MNWGLVVLWALVGWCGNEPRRWWKRPPPPPPWWLIVVDLLAGVIGGWAYSALFPQGTADMGLYAAATSLGAVVVGVLLHSILGMAQGAGATTG
jgi:hypothetical protein